MKRQAIDVNGKAAILEDGSRIPYDNLIVATGTTHSYFGHDEWAPFAPGLKTLDDALEIRRRVLLAFERAERETDPARRAAWLTFVVIGGGATGVELAGTLRRDRAPHAAAANSAASIRTTRAWCWSRAPSACCRPIRPTCRARRSCSSSASASRCGSARMVTGVDADGVSLGNERLAARTVVWAAGRRGSPLGASLGAPLDRAGRVQRRARPLGARAIRRSIVVGDLAAVDGVPGIAPAAKQMGRHAAQNIVHVAERQERPQPFRYRDYGQLATIGRNAAVAMLGKVKLSGFPAWLVWLVAHIYFLINFRNRLIVMIDWGWAYLTYQRYARIIFGKNRTSLDLLHFDHALHARVQPADVVVLAGLVDGQRGLLPAQEDSVLGPPATVIWCGVSSLLKKVSALPAIALIFAGRKANEAMFTSPLRRLLALRQRLRAREGVVQLGERDHEILLGVRQVAGEAGLVVGVGLRVRQAFGGEHRVFPVAVARPVGRIVRAAAFALLHHRVAR